MELELSPELLLLVPLGNLCPTDAMDTLVGPAKLVPSGITSAPSGTTGILELGWPELPSTTGKSERLEMPCLSGWPESPDLLLALLGNTFLTGITS